MSSDWFHDIDLRMTPASAEPSRPVTVLPMRASCVNRCHETNRRTFPVLRELGAFDKAPQACLYLAPLAGRSRNLRALRAKFRVRGSPRVRAYGERPSPRKQGEG